MSITRKHYDGLHFLSAHFIVKNLVSTFFPELDESVTTDNNKQLPFGIMPVLTFGYTRFRNIYTYLTAVQSMHKFREWATLVYICLLYTSPSPRDA